MVTAHTLENMDAQALRELAFSLMTQITDQNRELLYRQTKIDQLAQELAINRQWRFGRHS